MSNLDNVPNGLPGKANNISALYNYMNQHWNREIKKALMVPYLATKYTRLDVLRALRDIN